MNREAAGIVVARVLRRELVDVGGVPNVTAADALPEEQPHHARLAQRRLLEDGGVASAIAAFALL